MTSSAYFPNVQILYAGNLISGYYGDSGQAYYPQSHQPDFWRCRFCGRANDNERDGKRQTSCPGCGAHKGE